MSKLVVILIITTSLTVGARVENHYPYYPVSTPEEPQKAMIIQGQRDLIGELQ